MGACVSTYNQNQNQNHQNPSPSPSPSPMRKKLFGAANLLKQKPPIINYYSSGSKEETFFDSQAWLESDCDDDFMSVNGEFTPSRGSTPVHHNFSAGNKQQQELPVSPYPNTPEKKARLSDLFKDSLRADNYDFEDEDEHKDNDGEKKSSNGVKTAKRERLGCFRSLVPSRSSSTNGRKMMSPSPNPSPKKPLVG